MKEEEWLTSADPMAMLAFVEGHVCDRCLRLFACACCRRLWPLLTDPRSRQAVEIAELAADEMPSEMTLGEAWEQAVLVPKKLRKPARKWAVEAACDTAWCWEMSVSPKSAGQTAAESTASTAVSAADALTRGSAEQERKWQAELLRDVVGPLPFRPVAIPLAWLTQAVLAISRSAYEERDLPSGHLDLHRLAVLADALEEAGCANEDILNHLRGPGPHTRGCWVLDLFTGRE